MRRFVCLSVACALACVAALAMTGCSGCSSSVSAEDAGSPAEFYYGNSDVLETIEVSESESNCSEKQLFATAKDRGFKVDYAISDYDMDGTYLSSAEVSAKSKDLHPDYDFAYEGKDGYVWLISVINGQYMATPISYMEEKGESIIVSEFDYVTSYDAASGTYVQMIPHKDLARVVAIDRITPAALDKLIEEGF